MSTSNYLGLATVEGELRVLDDPDRQYEPAVGGLWTAVLSHYFSGQQGFVHRSQYMVHHGRTDMTTAYWRRNNGGILEEREFLVTQFKRRSYETRKARWRDAEEQLRRYLKGVRERDQSSADRITGVTYGIIAIGKLVSFYEYNETDGLEIWYIGEKERFHIENDNRVIHRFLLDIREEVLQ